jgi:flagellar basal-body rod protein FlgC
MDPLRSISTTAASGMRAQGERLRVVSENVANASTTAKTPGQDPYQRKTISFESAMDGDLRPFELRYDPSHPAADENGYIKLPNVNPLIEMSNMREASRSYEANLSMMENAREMRRQLVDMLK